MNRLAVSFAIFSTMILPALAADSHTQRLEFPAGGSIHLVDSFGELTIQGWDQPAVEITTTKTAYSGAKSEKALLDSVRIDSKTQGNTIVITTTRPHRRVFHPLLDVDDIDIEYSLRVPTAARLEIDHDHGEVNITGVNGDIQATSRYGPILVRLPSGGHYAIKAHCHIGTVYSDFAGGAHRHHLFGESFTSDSEAKQKLDLKVGMGDILILKLNGR